jgi:hypothetical protein
MTVSDLLEQPCNKSDNINQGCYKLVTAFSKVVDNLGQAVRTQFVDGLLTDLLQDVRFLRRQQVVLTTCQQIWNKLLTTCNNLVDIIRLVARLFQQVRYRYDITILLQPCVVNFVTLLLYHDCISHQTC